MNYNPELMARIILFLGTAKPDDVSALFADDPPAYRKAMLQMVEACRGAIAQAKESSDE